MKRFIDLSDQIIEGTKEFAFYDTTIDKFLEFQGVQTWETMEEFMKDYDGDDMERFTKLIPENWPNNA